MKQAPLFTAAYDLHGWLLDRLDSTAVYPEPAYPELRRAVLEHSRGLLEAIILALGRFEREERVQEADERTALLRAHLRLAADKGLLDDRQLLYASRLAGEIGRQIGGWQKALDGVA